MHYLKNIDLDPCSTYDANNQFLRAEKIYTYEIDGLNIEEPWTGKTYLFPPTFGRCSFAEKEVHGDGVCLQVKEQKLPLLFGLEDYLENGNLRNIPEALFFTTYPEMIRTCPEMWDFPVCVPTDRANLIHGKSLNV